MLIKELLTKAREKKASDIHIRPGAPISMRIARELIPVTTNALSPEESRELCYMLLTPEQITKFEKDLDFDFMLSNEHNRFRINLAHFSGAVGAVIRVLPDKPKSIDQLNLPDVVKSIASVQKGLVLITGSASQGKTTTMTAMIDHINRNHKKNIITIEDPIEYAHTNKKSVIGQRSIGKDTSTFRSGLRAALRQDPDVIAIGEMRDYESIRISLTAAETGILVFSTMHIISIDKIIERILSYGPPEDEMHLRFLLADSLQAVIHQELIPTVNRNKRVASEILIVTPAVANIIRRRGSYLLRNVITTGKRYGMTTMADSITELFKQKLITQEIAQQILANYAGEDLQDQENEV
jgi:twitching motility protein PilT